MSGAKGIPFRLTLRPQGPPRPQLNRWLRESLSSNSSLLLTGHEECSYLEKQNGQSQLLETAFRPLT